MPVVYYSALMAVAYRLDGQIIKATKLEEIATK
jgi:hypothetical protein